MNLIRMQSLFLFLKTRALKIFVEVIEGWGGYSILPRAPSSVNPALRIITYFSIILLNIPGMERLCCRKIKLISSTPICTAIATVVRSNSVDLGLLRV